MKAPLVLPVSAFLAVFLMNFMWGFYAHQKINRLAVFTLPPEMLGFYKENIQFITEAAVNPDRRRYVMEEEAARHYIDLDHYGDSAASIMPRGWAKAVEMFTEDTLQAYGILPWHIYRTYYRLRDAFLAKDADRILKLSADIGHYIADAHVPLHTTENYDGQLTGQAGIHAFWESRLPELFAEDYNFLVGKAAYIQDPRSSAWQAILSAHTALDTVFSEERKLAGRTEGRKHSFETKGRQTQRVYSREFSGDYHAALSGMVERQMRASIKMTGDFWYSAWIDAGQPDLKPLIDYKPSHAELQRRQKEAKKWMEQINSSSDRVRHTD